MDDLVKEIANLRRTLSGDEEGSLISQIKMLRQDSNDQQKNCKNHSTILQNIWSKITKKRSLKH